MLPAHRYREPMTSEPLRESLFQNALGSRQGVCAWSLDRPEASHVAHGRWQWPGEVVVGECECDEAWHACAKRWVNRPGKIVVLE